MLIRNSQNQTPHIHKYLVLLATREVRTYEKVAANFNGTSIAQLFYSIVHLNNNGWGLSTSHLIFQFHEKVVTQLRKLSAALHVQMILHTLLMQVYIQFMITYIQLF